MNEKKFIVSFEEQNIEINIKKDGDNFVTHVDNNEYHLSLNSQSNDLRIICLVNGQNMVVQVRKREA